MPWGLGVEIFLVSHGEAHREGSGLLVGIGREKDVWGGRWAKSARWVALMEKFV